METENPDTKPERETGNTEQQGGESQPGPAAPLPVAEPTHGEAKVKDADEGGDETDHEQGEAFNKLAQAEQEQTKWEQMQGQWTRNGAVATVALGLATFLLLFHQTCTLSKQLEAMQSSSNDTQKMIVAMQQQANASQNTADQQRDIVEQMGRQANASIDAANAATKQAAASQTQANASVTQAEAAKQSARATELTAGVTQKTFYIGERPYVWVREMSISGIAAGQQPKIVVTFENAGRTPALNFLHQTQFAPTPQPLNDILGYGPIVTLPSQGFIPAGGTITKTHNHPEQVSESDVERIKSGKVFLYFWGFATYEDGVGRKHTLKFCGLYAPSRDTFQSCPFYNSTD